MQAPSSRKISTGYQPAVTGFPPRDSSRSPGSLRAGPREDAPTGDPGRDLRFRDIPADATRPDQLRIDSAGAKRRNRLGPGRSPRADSPRTSESGLNAELSRRHPSRSLRAVYPLRVLAATRAADSFTESRARWAWRAVVWILLCPSNLSIIGRTIPDANGGSVMPEV